jgi:protease IV
MIANMKCFPLILLATIALAGCGMPSFVVTPVATVSGLQETTVHEGKGYFAKKVAIIEVEGLLANRRESGLLEPGENPISLFAEQLDKAEADSEVEAVVLRINSPGGTVTAADIMYDHVMQFRQRTRKPVVASTQDLAASGGYYVACGADRIVSQPTGIVGSVGVIFLSLNFEGTMSKIGVRSDAIKSGSHKDMGSPLRTLTAEERTIFQDMIDQYYARFRGVVQERRKITDPAKMAVIGDGRVMTAQQAMGLGLVDQLGSLNDALVLAQTLAGDSLHKAKVVMYKRPYEYAGSVYAASQRGPNQAQTLRLELPGAQQMMPTGFYYLWQP